MEEREREGERTVKKKRRRRRREGSKVERRDERKANGRSLGKTDYKKWNLIDGAHPTEYKFAKKASNFTYISKVGQQLLS